MPRRPRVAPGGLIYHVLNRANARRQIFFTEKDYAAFERVLNEAIERHRGGVELFDYVLMPNHWHLVLRPRADGELSEFMQWLGVTHTVRWHGFHQTHGNGHLYQGRFKSFPIESDDQHFLAVCRYVERNPLRARLVTRAEEWRFGSLWKRVHGCEEQTLSPWPVDEPTDWLALVNRPQTVGQEVSLAQAIEKGRPFGSEHFQNWTMEILGLQAAFRDRGRPRSNAEAI